MKNLAFLGKWREKNSKGPEKLNTKIWQVRMQMRRIHSQRFTSGDQ